MSPYSLSSFQTTLPVPLPILFPSSQYPAIHQATPITTLPFSSPLIRFCWPHISTSTKACFGLFYHLVSTRLYMALAYHPPMVFDHNHTFYHLAVSTRSLYTSCIVCSRLCYIKNVVLTAIARLSLTNTYPAMTFRNCTPVIVLL